MKDDVERNWRRMMNDRKEKLKKKKKTDKKKTGETFTKL